ncbi:class III cytochrome C family protein [Geobacter sp. OR-1]|uniref:selenite/tellurite reduction operon c-type cytochrome ExtM n=1 Tax=Geobacter sp. OR-1 TaxID=1266765 RepID=UPI000541DE64|nr:selenite/tellurite reduction operon c-type cytochrome ExtM [Geobacter sp. OR-1]GAM09323.1 class III cytochrome C family protein [Geobacter sp. OR-1]
MVALLLCAAIQACSSGRSPSSSCTICHHALESASASHTDCISCHFNFRGSGSHQPLNPGDSANWEQGCGPCHLYQLNRVKSGLMYTNRGMIRNIQLTWEGDDGKEYASHGVEGFDADGNRIRLRPAAELDNLSGELYRKFCSRCHLGVEIADAYRSNHAGGCAACHFPFNENAAYAGRDATVSGKGPLSATHGIEPLPSSTVCAQCHNRSGRIALSYLGLYDGNNGHVPIRKGQSGPEQLSGNRNAVHIEPDIHAAAGMECIDCHTSRDVMGDGYSYRNMYHQVEISCEDCHGGKSPPTYRVVTFDGDEAVRESRAYKVQVRPGMKTVLTAKGRPYSNVIVVDGKVRVIGKKSGRFYTGKVITGTPEHAIKGHERLECYACHSRTVVQCYGCHTSYDRRENAMDFIKGIETPGAFSETEDYRTLYPFPLAINQRGKVSPVTPGCQTFVSEVDESGKTVRDDEIARFRGKRRLRFAPFYSHNTGSKAVGCRECHSNPRFLGFGQGVIEGAAIEGTMLCDKCPDKPLDGFLKMADGRVAAFAAITRENSRPLNGVEIRRIFRVNLCLTCHDKGRDKDRIYERRLDYGALANPLHRRILDGH